MESWVVFFFFLILLQTALITRSSDDVDTGDFISIDCGIPDGFTYVNAKTKLPYVSDSGYTDSGTNYNISSDIMKNLTSTTTLEQYMITLRSFPQGRRNCYTLPAKKGAKYLLRPTFLHGNYDGSGGTISADNPVLFDLYLGVNRWRTVNISDPAFVQQTASVITVALADHIFVCLINRGKGTPFMSSLELRPLESYMYPNATESVALVTYDRFNYGARSSEQPIRYPDDSYDRLWWAPPAPPLETLSLQTTSIVTHHTDDNFMVPSTVLQTAVVRNDSDPLQLSWTSAEDEDVLPLVHIILHFAEIQLQQDESREFRVSLNGLFQGISDPEHFVASNVHTAVPFNTYLYNVSLEKTAASSAFPPIINAMEVYSVLELKENATDAADVDAIWEIKRQYKVKKDWTGDPCAPISKWEGLVCSDSSDAPRITAVYLSSSGLTGELNPSFAELKAVAHLDLSYNNLTGTIPASLAELPLLQTLDLRSNQLNGQIPDALLKKVQDQSLQLWTGGNPELCDNSTSCKVSPKSRKKLATHWIALLCLVSVIIVLLVAILCWSLRKPQGLRNYVRSHYEGGGAARRMGDNDASLQFETRQFTYMELKNITDNFAKVLGKGGFGTVYHGYLEDNTQVAVKIRSQSSSQGVKEFLAEAQHLLRVHHRNLVSMIGYCKDGDYLALVYEHMSNGTLREHLRGQLRDARGLSWEQRLQIAVDAAQGLEYLHNMCWPPLIHRDVKTENILLDERLMAKIADFGLSKESELDDDHISSKVVGTPGYVDPEYYHTFHLTEKSDVYSFGVILLELITGRPPIQGDFGNLHITQFVLQGLARGNIEDIVDPRLQGEYDVNSVWKCTDAALSCTSKGAHQRPAMADVVTQLKESLELVAPPRDMADDGVSAGSESLFREASFVCPSIVHSASVSTCEPSAR